MTLEQMNGFLRHAGIDPETGNKIVRHVERGYASKEFITAFEHTMETLTILERSLARFRRG